MDIVQRAEELGILRQGWRFLDYCLEAAPSQKWLCAILWGEKGNYKSNLLLQHGYCIFHGFDEYTTLDSGLRRGEVTNWEDMECWEQVLKYLVFRPDHFAKVISSALEKGERISWIGWDDINIHLPRSMYSTNRGIWEVIAKNWEGSRTSLSVFECTAPRKDKVVSFVLSDMAWDVLCSGRRIADVRRWMWDRDFYEPERVNKASIKVEEHEILPDNVPKEIWQRYWKTRIETNAELTQGLIEKMREIDKPPEVKARELKAFKCENCGREFGNQYNLNAHKCKKLT